MRTDQRGYTFVVAPSDTPLGYVKLISLASAVGLTVPDGARRALIQTEGKAVRWRDDGTDPTAADGLLIAADTTFSYHGALTRIRFIETAASAILHVAFYA